MMAAILNSTMLDLDTAMMDSDTFLSSVIFTPKHSPSTLIMTQTNSIWLTWWWQPSWIIPSWILPSWIQPFCTKLWLKLIQSDSTHSFWLNLMMAAILNSNILNLAILDSATLIFPHKLTSACQDWFPPFAQKNLHSFILTQLDDCSHLEFYHVGFRHCNDGFRHLLIFCHIHSKTLSLHSDSDSNNLIWLKLIYSHLTWWWQPSWILPSWIWPSWIQPS